LGQFAQKQQDKLFNTANELNIENKIGKVLFGLFFWSSSLKHWPRMNVLVRLQVQTTVTRELQ